MRTEETANRFVVEKSSLDHSVQRMEEEVMDLQKQLQQSQAQLAEAEQQHAQR